jgi:tetraprenyl-beta-curcumene synthase
MTDAVTPQAEPENYYHLYGCQEATYLSTLVNRCREAVSTLPAIEQVRSPLLNLIQYYIHLQALKHIAPGEREQKLRNYIDTSVPNTSRLDWWELAAATGSTLAMFALLGLAAHEGEIEKSSLQMFEAYFPWICGFHILLDYLIDEEEDRVEGDLNFVAYYPDSREKWQALERFLDQSLYRAAGLPEAALHLLVVRGLLAMYFTDPKVKQNGIVKPARALVSRAGINGFMLYHLCRLVRKMRDI